MSLPVIASQMAGNVTTATPGLSVIHMHSNRGLTRGGCHAYILLLLLLVFPEALAFVAV